MRDEIKVIRARVLEIKDVLDKIKPGSPVKYNLKKLVDDLFYLVSGLEHENISAIVETVGFLQRDIQSGIQLGSFSSAREHVERLLSLLVE